ncbi:acylneuraminate cytidylyltransferase family protein [Microcoleus sp. B9-D4]|uniref:acylneuraminate cytidylyltransferase family protein n=1 Tax=Microcoleus sp. B9-D4 TaxID=2818711 RepID=UPI002FCF26DD
MTIVSIVPCRGGSKGIPRKNVLSLAGKPLIFYSIEQSKQSSHADRTIISTDDQEIATVAKSYGAEVIVRPAEISGDTASSELALIHALDYLKDTENYEPDLVVFLQCTSPLRKDDDIDKAIIQFQQEQADSLLSVSPGHSFLWEQIDGVARSINYDYRNRPRRQEMNPQFRENGSIYIFKPWVLREYNNRLGGKISLYVMAEPCVDIDSMLDFEIAEFLLTKQHTNHAN